MKKLNEAAMQSELSGSTFFQPQGQQASKLASPPASRLAGKSETETVSQQARRQPSQSSTSTAPQPVNWAAPSSEARPLEEHAYVIFQDQARWLSRIQLDLAEGLGSKVNKYEIVQVALDWLRQDYDSNGEASQLIKKLSKNKP